MFGEGGGRGGDGRKSDDDSALSADRPASVDAADNLLSSSSSQMHLLLQLF